VVAQGMGKTFPNTHRGQTLTAICAYKYILLVACGPAWAMKPPPSR